MRLRNKTRQKQLQTVRASRRCNDELQNNCCNRSCSVRASAIRVDCTETVWLPTATQWLPTATHSVLGLSDTTFYRLWPIGASLTVSLPLFVSRICKTLHHRTGRLDLLSEQPQNCFAMRWWTSRQAHPSISDVYSQLCMGSSSRTNQLACCLEHLQVAAREIDVTGQSL